MDGCDAGESGGVGGRYRGLAPGLYALAAAFCARRYTARPVPALAPGALRPPVPWRFRFPSARGMRASPGVASAVCGEPAHTGPPCRPCRTPGNRRLLEPIGNIPPAEAEVNFYAALETDAMAA